MVGCLRVFCSVGILAFNNVCTRISDIYPLPHCRLSHMNSSFYRCAAHNTRHLFLPYARLIDPRIQTNIN